MGYLLICSTLIQIAWFWFARIYASQSRSDFQWTMLKLLPFCFTFSDIEAIVGQLA